ncbi:MAG: hypothetical protein AAFQ82_00745 [Myxococcota bacterium]
MEIYELKELAAPFYRQKDPGTREDYPDRVIELVNEWQESIEEPLDVDLLIAMSTLYAVSEEIRSTHQSRVGVEAWFVEQGWGNARIRGLMRSLERLPDQPKSMEEKLVADADTALRLDLFGLARALLTGGAKDEKLPDVLDRVQKDLYRRAYTAPGQQRIVPKKARLRDLLEELRAAL